jgi:hypothetical protein
MSDPGLAADLAAFLLARGCIAHTSGAGGVTALIPGLAGADGVGAISGLASRWQFSHPLVELDVTG